MALKIARISRLRAHQHRQALRRAFRAKRRAIRRTNKFKARRALALRLRAIANADRIKFLKSQSRVISGAKTGLKELLRKAK